MVDQIKMSQLVLISVKYVVPNNYNVEGNEKNYNHKVSQTRNSL